MTRIRVALIYRLIAFIVVGIGLLGELGVGFPFQFADLFYYTTLSNLLVFILFGYLLVKTISALSKKKNYIRSSSSFEMICMIDIFLTFSVYWVLLAPRSTSSLWNYHNLIIHGFSPLLCFFDYYLFARRKLLHLRDVFLALIFPLVYFICMIFVGAMQWLEFSPGTIDATNYPYFFMNFAEVGMAIGYYFIGLFIYLLIVGLIVFKIDEKRKKN